MPIFKREGSPSMRKMEVKNSSGEGRLKASVAKFNMSNIIGDPFSLATLGIGVGGWLIAFVSSIIADIDSQYPNFAWWSLVYMLFCIIGIFITVATDSVFTYHVAITGFVSAGLVFNTSAVNSLIYYSEGSKEAGAAGFILLSMVSIVWVFYFGSQPQASHRQAIDSFALHKDRPISRASRHMTQSYRPDTMHSVGQQPQMYNSAQLAGFETSSPVAGHPGNRYSQAQRESTAMFPPPTQAPAPALQPQQSQTHLPQMSAFAPGQQQQTQQPQPQQPQSMQTADSSISQPTVYPYRAKAIYSYEANPDDPNEISFNKHEILEVSDVSGRWWQAKKISGETGIAPSNYLILL